MSKLLNKLFSFKTQKYGEIFVMDEEALAPEIVLQDKNYFNPNENSLNLKEYLGKVNKEKIYKLRSFIEVNGILEPLTKFTFFNFPNNVESSLQENYLYLSNIAKKYQRTEVSSLAARLSRFLLYCHTGHKYPYVYLEVGDNQFGINICSKSGDELLFNFDLVLENITYVNRYPNFCNSGKTYAVIAVKTPLKSISVFFIEGLITEKEYETLKEYDFNLNGKE